MNLTDKKERKILWRYRNGKEIEKSDKVYIERMEKVGLIRTYYNFKTHKEYAKTTPMGLKGGDYNIVKGTLEDIIEKIRNLRSIF